MANKKLLWFLAPILLVLAIYATVLFSVDSNAEKDTSVKSDVIIALGAKSKVNNKTNVCLENRVKQGVQLYKKGLASKLIFSGGNEQAETMKQVALALGPVTQ